MDDDEFWDRIDALVSQVRDAQDPWDGYARAMEIAGETSDRIGTAEAAESAYPLWAGLSDLFDDPRLGRVPPAGAQLVLRTVAQEWLATPRSRRDRLIEEWLDRSWLSLIEEAGFRIDPAANPYVEEPWRGRWADIAWVIAQIGTTHSPFAAGQRVLRDIAEDSLLWRAAQGDVLGELLKPWETSRERRPELDGAIRAHLLRLRAEDVPAVQPAEHADD